MKGWVMRKFLVSKLKYNVIQKDEYFNVVGGVEFLCCCFGVLAMVLCNLV